MRQYSRTSIHVSVLACLFLCASAQGQWTTPAIDGNIGSGEYGPNNQLNNAGNTGQTWYMTWDADEPIRRDHQRQPERGRRDLHGAEPTYSSYRRNKRQWQPDRLQLRRNEFLLSALPRPVRHLFQRRL